MTVLGTLEGESDPLLAPGLLWQEVANALVTGVRRQRWSGAEADASFRLLLRLPVRRVDSALDLDRSFDLARRHDNHPIHDMVYVALALRLSQVLITPDQQLAAVLGNPAWLSLPPGIRG